MGLTNKIDLEILDNGLELGFIFHAGGEITTNIDENLLNIERL